MTAQVNVLPLTEDSPVAIETTSNNAYRNRLMSIDLLRGLALILMVLDHTRDFFGFVPYYLPSNSFDLSQMSISLFMTRWITYLCAPTFVFLAGVSAYLYGTRHTRKELSQFLFARGLWLIILEVTIITFAWKFTLDPTLNLQIIYVLGLSMIILAGLIWLPKPLIFLLSLTVIIGQQLLTNITPSSVAGADIWTLIYGYNNFDVGNWNITVFYSIIPWFAVMSLGYCFGPWFQQSASVRSKRFFWIGLTCVLAFCLLRYFNFYGNPEPWTLQPRGAMFTFISFINVNKYPASLQFLLVTFGIVCMLIPLIEKWDNAASRVVLVFGKASLFFYIIHLNLIHFLAFIYSKYILQAPHAEWWWGNGSWISNHYPAPANYHYSLLRVYAVWIAVIVLMYPLCLAYGRYKSRHTYKWLSYI